MACLTLQALLGSLALGLGAAVPVDQLLETRNYAAAAGLAITDNYHTLSRVRRSPGTSRTLDMLRRKRKNRLLLMDDDDDDDPEGVDHIRAELHQVEYIMQVGIGAEKYYMIPDTGSADTWVVREGYTCLDPYYGDEVAQDVCDFGPLFQGDFPGGRIEDQNLNISYLSGDYLNGAMGFGDITVANVTVPGQQFALVDVAAFAGADPAVDGPDNLVNYAPLVETMGASGAADPVLSFAMSRDEARSFIAFGGVPPVATGEYTAVPIQKGTLTTGRTDYFYYDIPIDAIAWEGVASEAQNATGLPDMLVDSGTTTNLFPREVAAAINGAYSPPGSQEDAMVWSVACDATPPALDVVIGGVPVRTHAASMILPETAAGGSNRCLSGVGAGQPGSYILGDTFLQEIVAVFDVSERMELKFAQRTD